MSPPSSVSDQSIPGEPLCFEHLVQINDLGDPRVQPLTRAQLWRGLTIRAEAPRFFMPWLDDSELSWREDGSLDRRLRFGDYEVKDRVRFVEGESVHYDVLETDQPARFSLTMRIEEPVQGALFVRFIYRAHSVDHHADSPLGDLVKAAYRQSDLDTVFRIRQLADIGALEPWK